MPITFDKVFYCRGCKQNEWCKVTDMEEYYQATTYVCGYTQKVDK